MLYRQLRRSADVIDAVLDRISACVPASSAAFICAAAAEPNAEPASDAPLSIRHAGSSSQQPLPPADEIAATRSLLRQRRMLAAAPPPPLPSAECRAPRAWSYLPAFLSEGLVPRVGG